MKNTLLYLSLSYFIVQLTYGQSIPSDSLLLKVIYKKVDIGGQSSTIDYPNPEYKINSEDSLTFKIIYKNYIYVNNIKKLYVVTRANAFYMQHPFGFTDIYYLAKTNNVWMITKSFKEKEPSPIGDSDEIEIVKIGKSKSAEISTFSSSGNHHLTKQISLSLITSSGLQEIGNIDLDYSNEAWIDIYDKSNIEKCTIESYESEYKVVESEKEWCDIIVTKKTKIFSKGCLNQQIKVEKFIYSFNGTKFVKMNSLK